MDPNLSNSPNGDVPTPSERVFELAPTLSSRTISSPGIQSLHRNCRENRPAEYPERSSVPDDQVLWQVAYPGYAPPYFLHPKVVANERGRGDGWADPEDHNLVPEIPASSLAGTIDRDDAGRPLNPRGRTGIAGRGLLGRWGPNISAEAVQGRVNPQRELELLFIVRTDDSTIGFPGGFMDDGEDPWVTAARELGEETAYPGRFTDDDLVFADYIDSRRNTDHAWIENLCFARLLDYSETVGVPIVAGDDARDAFWRVLGPHEVLAFYPTGREIVACLVEALLTRSPESFCDLEQTRLRELIQLARSAA